jgi:biotin transport system substrate-specific component
MGVGLFALMTTLGAYVYIPLPFTPVPFTLQTFIVLLSGAFLGKRGGALSQGLYLLLGGIGLPIWAGGAAGLSRLWGPTGGYLLAFPLAAWVVGLMLEGEKPPAWGRLWGAMALGSLMIYGLGLVQLCLWLQCGWKKALLLGALPFLPGDLVKMILAGFLCRKGNRRWIPA